MVSSARDLVAGLDASDVEFSAEALKPGIASIAEVEVAVLQTPCGDSALFFGRNCVLHQVLKCSDLRYPITGPGFVMVLVSIFHFLFHSRVHVICRIHDDIHRKTAFGQAFTSLENIA